MTARWQRSRGQARLCFVFSGVSVALCGARVTDPIEVRYLGVPDEDRCESCATRYHDRRGIERGLQELANGG